MHPNREVPPAVTATPTGELFSELAHTVGELVTRHVDLARAEAMAQLKSEAKMAGWMVAAGLLAFLGLATLLAAGVLALARIVPGWAAALIVAGAVFGAAGGLAAIGFQKRVKQPMWRTRETIQEDVRWLRPRTI
jgi:hypothetical protein